MVSPLAGRYNAWTDLLSEVEKNHGVLQVPMEALRQLEGAQRLGPNVLTSIQQRLASLGFRSLPEELPNRQSEFVVIYRVGTPASDTIQAIQQGLHKNSAVKGVYQALYQLNASPDPEEVVTRDELEEVAKTVADKAAHTAVVSFLEDATKGESDTKVKAGSNGHKKNPEPQLQKVERVEDIPSSVASGFSSS
jgi:hypothetical protein